MPCLRPSEPVTPQSPSSSSTPSSSSSFSSFSFSFIIIAVIIIIVINTIIIIMTRQNCAAACGPAGPAFLTLSSHHDKILLQLPSESSYQGFFRQREASKSINN
ncbi:uncharacterized protein BO97DRAFT_417576 [Aspergillus homomorphus CBS 101889]|uniref:Uncharacterized protein n=1 Tax=Aspergillus homomorphus (strain CBS 101889) TaxID=1450537 RepID=A0A395HKU9_ASPHC|nr:hypothetical protein BO97DRAFT_417576 [Aspergillus homomorphus CBS 101889]RAL08582.1 hypothetical protein BO97DRAFT_417576 [Aspergillus homomorphus CBS 101889]